VSGRLSGFMPEHEVSDKEALAARILMQRWGGCQTAMSPNLRLEIGLTQ
jgi:hypothetical protein